MENKEHIRDPQKILSEAKRFADNIVGDMHESHFTKLKDVDERLIPTLVGMLNEIIELTTNDESKKQEVEKIRSIILELQEFPAKRASFKLKDEATAPFDRVREIEL